MCEGGPPDEAFPPAVPVYLPGMEPPEPTRDTDRLQSFRHRLLSFFREESRDLPWRQASDPYRIWVSEIMLQQTRVETAVPYYREWVRRFPDLEALADAEEEEVLELWAGLGYYARARNLHSAARVVRDRFGGCLPRDPDTLRELPGVGEYTAGAVASIAFGVAVPAVDGNVRRVLARIHDVENPTPAQLRTWAGELVDPDSPGEFNQALMELGSTVCRPWDPHCSRCPVEGHCLAAKRGTARERPAAKRAPRVRRMDVGVAIPVRPGDGGTQGARVLIRRRPREGLLGGTWEFPGAEASGPESAREAAVLAAAEEGWSDVEVGPALPTVRHRFSHRAAEYRPFLFIAQRTSEPRGEDEDTSSVEAGTADRAWVAVDELGRVALPAAQRKIAELVRGRFAADSRTSGDYG